MSVRHRGRVGVPAAVRGDILGERGGAVGAVRRRGRAARPRPGAGARARGLLRVRHAARTEGNIHHFHSFQYHVHVYSQSKKPKEKLSNVSRILKFVFCYKVMICLMRGRDCMRSDSRGPAIVDMVVNTVVVLVVP